MINIATADNCGFCFGVRNAVELLLEEIELGIKNNTRIYLFGKIIHNDSFIEEIIDKSKGLLTVIDDKMIDNLDFDAFEENSSVIIRAHGIPKEIFERLKKSRERKNIKIVDATCKCVKRMHAIAGENTGGDTLTLIFGDANHPEIAGLKSYVSGECKIYKDFGALKEDFEKSEKFEKKLIILVQTTHNIKDYIKCKDFILANNAGENAVFFDTVCGETEKRQAEAEKLSKESDVMIVVGGHNSSNTKKLFEICKKNCADSFIVETSEQMPLNILKNLVRDLNKEKDAVKVSITAGASTPDSIIMEVKKIMTDNIGNGIDNGENNIEEGVAVSAAANANVNPEAAKIKPVKDMTAAFENIDWGDGEKSFEELLNQTFSPISRGDRVKGRISYISDGEIHVDMGYKYTGILTFDEVTDDSSADLKEMFKVGDEIETQIIKTNDQEGIALLSKKRVDSNDIWDKVVKMFEEGTVVDGKVIQVVNGGIIALIDSMRVFVPASHADVSKDTDLNTLIGKNVKLKIIDINAQKHRAIASIRNASAEARKEVEDKVWGEIELNKKYEGTVKSIANYGVFVDIGGIDGMVHITELSWSRIKHPSEVIQLGDKIKVYIKDFDRERKRIALGYRDENENPWTKFTAETQVGDVVDAKILNMMPFGAFAEIRPGVDGLIHISQIVDKKISKPSEVLNVGDIVQVKITDIDPEAKKISLSMRALIEPEAIPEGDGDDGPHAELEVDGGDISEAVEAAEEIKEVKEAKSAKKAKAVKETAAEEVKEEAAAEVETE